MEESFFLAAISDLAAYYGRNLPDSALSAWWDALNCLSPDELLFALNRCYQEDAYLPTPARILSILGKDSASEARKIFASILAAVASGQSFVDAAIPPDAIKIALSFGDRWYWDRLTEKETRWVEKRFVSEFSISRKNFLPQPKEDPIVPHIVEKLNLLFNR